MVACGFLAVRFAPDHLGGLSSPQSERGRHQRRFFFLEMIHSPRPELPAAGFQNTSFRLPGGPHVRANDEYHGAVATRDVQTLAPAPPSEIWGSEDSNVVGHEDVFDYSSWTSLAGSANYAAPGRFSSASSLTSHRASMCESHLGKRRPKPRCPVEILGRSALIDTPQPPAAGAVWEQPGEPHLVRLPQTLQVSATGHCQHRPASGLCPRCSSSCARAQRPSGPRNGRAHPTPAGGDPAPASPPQVGGGLFCSFVMSSSLVDKGLSVFILLPVMLYPRDEWGDD